MKSLKSRLRRQDAPGSSSSGAATSAVSPAARARPGLPALLPRTLPGCRSALLPRLARSAPRSVGPGDSASLGLGLRVGPETLGTLSTYRPRATRDPFPASLPQVSELRVLRDQIALSPSGVSGLFSFPGAPRGLPRSPRHSVPVPLHRGLGGCGAPGPRGGFAPGIQVVRAADPAPPGPDSGSSVRQRLGD